MAFTFRDLKKKTARAPTMNPDKKLKFNSREEEILYYLRLKNIEQRTLMRTLKDLMSPEEYDQLIVDYNLRLRKAKKNYEKNNWKGEWDEYADE
ncbi:hypothetical protein D3C71_901020 [compost metagenome]